MNFHGLAVGIVMIFAIGLGHIIVVKWEYYWGAKSWAGMLVIGLGLIIASLFVGNMLLSATLGMFGATMIWGIHELLKQKQRVQKGLFPRNPNRTL
jgi:hypothetical protein